VLVEQVALGADGDHGAHRVEEVGQEQGEDQEDQRDHRQSRHQYQGRNHLRNYHQRHFLYVRRLSGVHLLHQEYLLQ